MDDPRSTHIRDVCEGCADMRVAIMKLAERLASASEALGQAAEKRESKQLS